VAAYAGIGGAKPENGKPSIMYQKPENRILSGRRFDLLPIGEWFMSFLLRGARRIAPAALVAAVCLFTAGFVRAEDEPTELMPDNADVVAKIEFAKILSSPAFKKVKEEFPQADAKLDEPMGKKTKLTPRQIKSVFVAANTAKREFAVVMTMTTKVTEEDVRTDEVVTEEKVGDYTIYVNEAEKASFCLIDDNTVLMAPAETLRTILKRDDDAEISDELDAAWEDVDDSKPVYVVSTLGSLMKEAGASLPPGFPLPPTTLEKVETATLTADAGEDLAIAIAVGCADEATAQQIKAILDAVVQQQAANPAAPPGVGEALGGFKTALEDSTINITLKVGVDLILSQVKAQLGGAAAPKP
jgi:hypothetical protein